MKKLKPITFTPQEIITICRYKHYRTGYEGAGNYGRLQELLRTKGLSVDEIKQCLHP
jgi:hypothetical protein